MLASFITAPSVYAETSQTADTVTAEITDIQPTIPPTTTIAGGNQFALLSSRYSVYVGDTVTIKRCGTALPDSWTIEGEDIISLDSTGMKVTGLKEGTASIFYKQGKVTQKAEINVTNGPSKTFTDKVVYKAGQFIFFARYGVFKIDKNLTYPEAEPFRLGNTVKTSFEYEIIDDMPTITAITSAEVISSEDIPDQDIPDQAEFTDTIEAVDLNCVQFRKHGRYYLNMDYALIYSKEFTRLEPGEEVTASFQYKGDNNTRIIISVDKLDSAEKDVCPHCGSEVPRNHLINTNLGQRVCDDCKDFGWCGTPEQLEFTDTVIAKYGRYITFRTHGRYNTAKAAEPADCDILNNLVKGDTVYIKFDSIYTYEASMRQIYEIALPGKAVVTTSPDAETVTTKVTTTTTTTSFICDTKIETTTTTEEPERWMYGTGVDHFDSIKTLPTKTIYTEGEELDLSGLVINAYHSVSRHNNKGYGETLRTDYVWEVEKIAPEYITISDFTGKTYTADEFPKLYGGSAYIVKIGGKTGYSSINLNVKGDKYEKELYGLNDFTFRVYINQPDAASKFIRIDNAEVESFEYGITNYGFKLKDMDAFRIDMDAHMHPGYEINFDIRKGDTVSGALRIDTKSNYIILGDLEIVKYGGETGDANCDNTLDMADAVLIMQSLANPNKYGLDGTDERRITKRGVNIADLNGDGITVLDAQLIQNKLLGL